MKLMTRAFLLDKYGPVLSMEQVAEAINVHVGTLYNMASQGELKVRTYKEGARRYASYEAVAEYLDARDEAAKKEMAQ